ncbi:MAG: cardiolipin synthase [Eubacteriales bacterium]
MKRIFHFITSRAGVTILLILIEIGWLVSAVSVLGPYISWLETALRIASIFIVLYIVAHSRHMSSDMMWVVTVLAFPVPGTIMYYVLNIMQRVSSKTYRSIVTETEKAQWYYHQDPQVLKEAENQAPDLTRQFEYISGHAGFPVYRNRGFSYYSSGEEGWPVMLAEMKKAKRFIFLEYFIIEEGVMWDAMLDVLKEKAAEGVECRVLYDDLGSINTLPQKYTKELEKAGIFAEAFNRVNSLVNGIMNHRDHRKILVIDGLVAFSGGINLADEYINVKEKYGYWKDNCFRVTGEAVWSFTVMFLTTWNALRHQDLDYRKYCAGGAVQPDSGDPERKYAGDEEQQERFDGWIAPYGETPLDSHLIGEGVYYNILNEAQHYCYIITPYLIIDEDLTNALIFAAEQGVDVRILTPGIPDKRIVWNVTKSYYRNLIENGVKIYEYTPGFVHSKIFVSDDRMATVGTINLDYRSLYLHFENGVFLYGSRKVAKVRDDFLQAQAESHQITAEDCYMNPVKRFIFSIFRIYAPLM